MLVERSQTIIPIKISRLLARASRVSHDLIAQPARSQGVTFTYEPNPTFLSNYNIYRWNWDDPRFNATGFHPYGAPRIETLGVHTLSFGRGGKSFHRPEQRSRRIIQ